MDFNDLDDDFVSVPLPDQMPRHVSPTPAPLRQYTPREAQPNLNIPLKSTPVAAMNPPSPQTSSYEPDFERPAVKSRTVQTLMSQNHDLMARLTVSMKRDIELEQKIENQEDQYQKLSTQYDLMKNQLELIQEKNKRVEFTNEKLTTENSGLEKRFAELYTAYQDKIGHIQKLSYRLHRYLQYRTRIKKIVQPFIHSLKAQILNAREEYLNLNDKSLKQAETISELKGRLTESVDHIQSITAKFERDQSDLVGYHENRHQQMSAEMNALKGHAENIHAANAEYKKAIEEYKENEVALQNKSIFFERKYTDLKNEFEHISREFIEQKTNDNSRLTTLEIQIKELSSQYTMTLETKNNLELENRAVHDQYQSLQMLYQDSSNKIDELRKMNQAQDQINKEISQSMIETRKKSESVQQKLVETEEDFKRKIQSFQGRFQKNETSSQALTSTPPAGQKELLSKIQNLLSEIQTGQNHVGLDFQESGDEKPSKPEQLISEYGDLK